MEQKEIEKFVQDIFNAFNQESSLITPEQKKICERVKGIEQANDNYRKQIETLQTYLVKNQGKIELLVEDLVTTMPKKEDKLVDEKLEEVSMPEKKEE